MMRFQVFLSLWSVTSCSCIDKIPKVAKTKVSKPKRYSWPPMGGPMQMMPGPHMMRLPARPMMLVVRPGMVRPDR